MKRILIVAVCLFPLWVAGQTKIDIDKQTQGNLPVSRVTGAVSGSALAGKQDVDNNCKPDGSGTLNCATVKVGTTVLDSTGVATAKVTAGATVFADIVSYGAKCDGMTDDSTAIAAALTWANSVQGTLYLPPNKTCVFAQTLNITKSLHLSGYGSTLKNTSTNPSIHIASGAGAPVLEGFTLTSSASSGTADGIQIGDADTTNGSSAVIRDVSVDHHKGNGINIRNGNSGLLDNVIAHDNGGHGILLKNQQTAVINVNAWTIISPKLYANVGDGYHVENATSNQVVGMVTEGNGGWGVYCNYPGQRISGHVDSGNTAGDFYGGVSCSGGNIQIRINDCTNTSISSAAGNWLQLTDNVGHCKESAINSVTGTSYWKGFAQFWNSAGITGYSDAGSTVLWSITSNGYLSFPRLQTNRIETRTANGIDVVSNGTNGVSMDYNGGTGHWKWYGGGSTIKVDLDQAAGTLDLVGGYKVGGVAGVDKTCTGAPTAMTVTKGIITAITCP